MWPWYLCQQSKSLHTSLRMLSACMHCSTAVQPETLAGFSHIYSLLLSLRSEAREARDAQLRTAISAETYTYPQHIYMREYIGPPSERSSDYVGLFCHVCCSSGCIAKRGLLSRSRSSPEHIKEFRTPFGQHEMRPKRTCLAIFQLARVVRFGALMPVKSRLAYSEGTQVLSLTAQARYQKPSIIITKALLLFHLYFSIPRP